MAEEDLIEQDESLHEEPTAEEIAAAKEQEDEARKYGWRPKEEFDRDPEGWVDADRFLELPSTHVKMMRDERKALEAKFEQDRQQWRQELAGIKAVSQKAIERAREQERSEWQARVEAAQAAQRKAAEDHDTVALLEAQNREKRLLSAEPKPEPTQGPRAPAPDDLAFMEKYRAENEWTKHPGLMAEGAQYINMAAEGGRSFSNWQEQVEYAEGLLKQKYPHVFQVPAPAVSRVESGGMAPARRPAGRGADDLPPEAKRVGQEYVSEGIYKNLAEYAKDYWAEA